MIIVVQIIRTSDLMICLEIHVQAGEVIFSGGGNELGRDSLGLGLWFTGLEFGVHRDSDLEGGQGGERTGGGSGTTIIDEH